MAEVTEQPILLDDVKRLVVPPGGTIIVTVRGRLTSDLAQRIKTVFTDALRGVAVIIVDSEIELSVVTSTDD